MFDILRLLFVIVLLTIGLAAYFLVVVALFPQRVAAPKAILQSMPARAFGLGLVNFVFFAVIAMALLAAAENAGPFIKGILTIPALIILTFLAVILSFGLAAACGLIGERILPDATAWKQTLWGTVCLTLACAVPFVGWFLLLPYMSFVGVGAVILGFFHRTKI